MMRVDKCLKWIRTTLVALIVFMLTPPNGALGSLDYNKEERWRIAIKSWEAPPKFGTPKRQKVIDEGRASLIVAFSPTGWTLGKGKKSAGRKRQQGSIIRYEVPYNEHCSFEELEEFTKLISPVKIIPSVNNEDEFSSKSMTELLLL